MSARTFRGNPTWRSGIPRNSKIRIVTLPECTVVYENDRVSESITVDLDPGYYHMVVKKLIGRNAQGRLTQVRYEERFYHDLTENEYAVLSNMRPQRASGRLLSGGWNYNCGWAGCDYYCSNPIAMVLHECEHNGISREEMVNQSDYMIDQMHEQARIGKDAKGKSARAIQ